LKRSIFTRAFSLLNSSREKNLEPDPEGKRGGGDFHLGEARDGKKRRFHTPISSRGGRKEVWSERAGVGKKAMGGGEKKNDSFLLENGRRRRRAAEKNKKSSPSGNEGRSAQGALTAICIYRRNERKAEAGEGKSKLCHLSEVSASGRETRLLREVPGGRKMGGGGYLNSQGIRKQTWGGTLFSLWGIGSLLGGRGRGR